MLSDFHISQFLRETKEKLGASDGALDADVKKMYNAKVFCSNFIKIKKFTIWIKIY